MLSINAPGSQGEAVVFSTSKGYEATLWGPKVYTKEEFFGTVAMDLDGTEDTANFSDYLSPHDASNVQLPTVRKTPHIMQN
jgi:hypothetical protein